MSKVSIHDLACSQELDHQSMSAVRGGRYSLSEMGPFANVNVGVEQNIVQVQNIEVNALNNVGVIGAGFGPLALNVSPKQSARAGLAL
ncbi:MAG: hypothetical protein ACM3X0_02830 [Bacteroidota bacterium]